MFSRSTSSEVFCKAGVFKHFAKLAECARVSFLLPPTCNLIKKGTRTKKFSYKLHEMLTKTYFVEHLWATTFFSPIQKFDFNFQNHLFAIQDL